MDMQDNISILWLEDEPRVIFHHVKKLEELGFHIIICRSVTEAKYETERRKFDVILCDLLMPPPDGIDFLKQVRTLQTNAIFIVFTAHPYNNIYRKRIKDLKFKIDILQKSENLSEITICIFQALYKSWPKINSEKKNIWKRIIEALEIKPGFGGIAMDIKKLFGIRNSQD